MGMPGGEIVAPAVAREHGLSFRSTNSFLFGFRVAWMNTILDDGQMARKCASRQMVLKPAGELPAQVRGLCSTGHHSSEECPDISSIPSMWRACP
jgi:hypothetical protein